MNVYCFGFEFAVIGGLLFKYAAIGLSIVLIVFLGMKYCRKLFEFLLATVVGIFFVLALWTICLQFGVFGFLGIIVVIVIVVLLFIFGGNKKKPDESTST